MEQVNTEQDMSLIEVEACDAVSEAERPITASELRALLAEQQAAKRTRRTAQSIGALSLAVIALTVLVAAFLLIPRVNATLERTNAAIETIDPVRIAGLLDGLETFVDEGIGVVTEINGIDFDTLNDAIGNLDGAVHSFAQMDVETLNKAIANLNSTVEPLAKLLNMFKK